MPSLPLGKKEDFAWAILTAAATAFVVKLAEWGVESIRENVRRAKDKNDD